LEAGILRSWIPLQVDMPVSSTEIRQNGHFNMIDKRIKEEVEKLLNNKKGKNE
jgi:hypothetical protein